jgi:DNA-directed RNA polymerase specialized sigma24 family protein
MNAPASAASEISALVQSAQTGNQAAKDEVWIAAERFLRWSARGLHCESIQGVVDPEDLAHEALIGAMTRLCQYQGRTDAQFFCWLRTILVHCLQAARRRRGCPAGRPLPLEAANTAVDKAGSSPTDDPEATHLLRQAESVARLSVDGLTALERLEALRPFLDYLFVLPRTERSMVWLHWILDMQLEDVAVLLSWPVGKVRGFYESGISRMIRAWTRDRYVEPEEFVSAPKPPATRPQPDQPQWAGRAKSPPIPTKVLTNPHQPFRYNAAAGLALGTGSDDCPGSQAAGAHEHDRFLLTIPASRGQGLGAPSPNGSKRWRLLWVVLRPERGMIAPRGR